MPRNKKTKWEKNFQRVLRAQDAAIRRVNELREAGWYVSEELMNQIRQPLSSRYTEQQAKQAIQKYSLRRINFAAKKSVADVVVRKTQRFDEPYNTIVEKLLNKPDGQKKLSEAIAKDVKHTLDPRSGTPSVSKAASWVELLLDLQNESGIKLLPHNKKGALIKSAYTLDIDPAKLEQAIEKSKWSFREVGDFVYNYIPDIRGDRQEQIARSKNTLRHNLHAPARVVEAIFDFFENSIYWNRLTNKQRHAVSSQIVSTMNTYDEAANKMDIAELDRRLLQGGDPVKVVEDYLKELIGDSI